MVVINAYSGQSVSIIPWLLVFDKLLCFHPNFPSVFHFFLSRFGSWSKNLLVLGRKELSIAKRSWAHEYSVSGSPRFLLFTSIPIIERYPVHSRRGSDTQVTVKCLISRPHSARSLRTSKMQLLNLLLTTMWLF